MNNLYFLADESNAFGVGFGYFLIIALSVAVVGFAVYEVVNLIRDIRERRKAKKTKEKEKETTVIDISKKDDLNKDE